MSLTSFALTRPAGVPDCVPRWATPRNLERKTLGPKVAKVAELVGIDLMEWQRRVLDVALEVDPVTGRLVYREVRLTVPRQSGKTTLLLALMTHRCIGFDTRQRVVFTMQTRQDARQKLFEDYKPVLVDSPIGSRVHVRESNGMERMSFPNGSVWGLVATGEKSGHGPTVDLGVLDEAFASDGKIEQGIKPSQITRASAQFWVVSTAGHDQSTYFNRKTDDGRELVERGQDSGVCYFEWSASDDEDPADHDTWWRCMPALGVTVPIESVQADFDSMELDDFKRAYLNIRHDRRKSRGWAVIQQKDWTAAVDPGGAVSGPLVFGIDVSPSRDRASIAVAAARPDGRTGVEIVDEQAGADWVLARMVAVAEKLGDPFTVVIDKGSQAKTLIDPLRAKGFTVHDVNSANHSAWCGQFYDAVKAGRVAHRGQGPLTDAAKAGQRRVYGDAWFWDRRVGSNVTPLVSATLAFGQSAHPAAGAVKKPVFAY